MQRYIDGGTMPRLSQSKYAILGVLTLGPHSGYDIKKYSETVLSHFWHESYGNLYSLLKRMRDEGLVESKTEIQEGKPNRIVYSITVLGQEAFCSWLRESAEPEVIRSELLLKLFFGDQMPLECVLEHLETYRAQQDRIVHNLKRAQREDGHAPPPTNLFQRLTLRRGLLLSKARLQWANECLQMLSATTKE